MLKIFNELAKFSLSAVVTIAAWLVVECFTWNIHVLFRYS